MHPSQKESIEHLVSLERLDTSLKVVGIRGWLALFFFAAIALVTLIWSFLGSIPLTVSGKCLLIDLDSSGSLKILAFLPLSSGQQVQPGMRVQTAIDIVDSDNYGTIQGVVIQSSPYPVSASDPILQKIPSEPLREYLVQGPLPVLLAIVDPALDPKTVSGLKWTSLRGPPMTLSSGLLGKAGVILEEKPPISYVFPMLQWKKGHAFKD